jgi:hypothetical protein
VRLVRRSVRCLQRVLPGNPSGLRGRQLRQRPLPWMLRTWCRLLLRERHRRPLRPPPGPMRFLRPRDLRRRPVRLDSLRPKDLSQQLLRYVWPLSPPHSADLRRVRLGRNDLPIVRGELLHGHARRRVLPQRRRRHSMHDRLRVPEFDGANRDLPEWNSRRHALRRRHVHDRLQRRRRMSCRIFVRQARRVRRDCGPLPALLPARRGLPCRRLSVPPIGRWSTARMLDRSGRLRLDGGRPVQRRLGLRVVRWARHRLLHSRGAPRWGPQRLPGRVLLSRLHQRCYRGQQRLLRWDLRCWPGASGTDILLRSALQQPACRTRALPRRLCLYNKLGRSILHPELRKPRRGLSAGIRLHRGLLLRRR